MAPYWRSNLLGALPLSLFIRMIREKDPPSKCTHKDKPCKNPSPGLLSFPHAHIWTCHVKTRFGWCSLWTPFLSSRLRTGHGENTSGGLLSVEENFSGGWSCGTLILALQPLEQGKTCFCHLSPTTHGIYYYESLGWLIQHFQQNRVFLIQPAGIMWTLWSSPFIHIIRFRKPQ